MELNNKVKFKETEIGIIPEEWETLSLNSFLIAKNQGVNTTTEKVSYSNTGIPIVRANNVSDYKIDYEDLVYVDDINYLKIRKECRPKDGDVLYTPIGSQFGSAALVKENKEFGIAWNVMRMQPDNKKITSSFLVYLLNNPENKMKIRSLNTSSTMPFVSGIELGKTKFSIPSIDEQKRITEILSSLDDKIELNRKINSNLEKIASLLFKQWFINTNEKGFKTIRLGDFFPIKTGKKDANIAIKNGKYPFFTCSQDILFTDNFSFDSSSILLAGNGDFNIKWYEGKFEAYQRTYVLTPYKKELLGFLYFLMDYFLDDITVGHRGSVIKFITKGMIEDFEVKIPIDKDFNNKAKFFYEIIQVIDFYEKEIKNLSQIRDFLLPRLMNGKIRVKI